jgi:branched-chain amino acid transport system permease protein
VLLTIFIFDFVIETYVRMPPDIAPLVPVVKLLVYGITLIVVLMFRPFGLLGSRRRTRSVK